MRQLRAADHTSAEVVTRGACGCAGMIGAEFEEVYQTVHEGRARFWGMGLFGGSNGYWDSATLKVRVWHLHVAHAGAASRSRWGRVQLQQACLV